MLVQFSKLTACVTCIDNSYDVEVCTDKSQLVYGKLKTYKYTCKFLPSPNDVGKEITVRLYSIVIISTLMLLHSQFMFCSKFISK